MGPGRGRVTALVSTPVGCLLRLACESAPAQGGHQTRPAALVRGGRTGSGARTDQLGVQPAVRFLTSLGVHVLQLDAIVDGSDDIARETVTAIKTPAPPVIPVGTSCRRGRSTREKGSS